jgi:tetratricopeptide (TPR) repeat protein
LVTVMRRALRGEKDPSAADSLVCIAHALRKKEEYAQAIKELKRALKIYRESLGDAHAKVSTTVDEIASLYVAIGDFDKSAAILEEVVKLKAATLGMKSKEVAFTLTCLATTYECSEQFTKSMKSLKKAYKIYTEMGGYSSVDSTTTLNRIAQLYEATGDYNRASIAYLGVLRGRKINHGNGHLLVGETYFRLGRSLRETGQVEKALKCMKEALPIFVGKGVEMNDVEMIAEIMHEMAILNKEKKHFSEAARIFKQELGVRRKIGQPEFPLIARTLNHMGVTEFELKNNARALKYLIEALSIFQKRGEQGIDCAEVLFNAGLVFEASHNKERAVEAFNEAARIFKHHGYKDSHPHLVKAYYKIEKLRAQKNSRK